MSFANICVLFAIFLVSSATTENAFHDSQALAASIVALRDKICIISHKETIFLNSGVIEETKSD
jgi:hypothetical protein